MPSFIFSIVTVILFNTELEDTKIASSDSAKLITKWHGHLQALSMLHSFKVSATGTMTRLDYGKPTITSKIRIDQVHDAVSGCDLYMSELPNFKEGHWDGGRFIEHSDKYDRESGVVITRPDYTIIYTKMNNTIGIYPNDTPTGYTFKKIDMRLVGYTDSAILSGKLKIDTMISALDRMKSFSFFKGNDKWYYRPKENIPNSNAGPNEALFYKFDSEHGVATQYEHLLKYPTDSSWYDKCYYVYTVVDGLYLPQKAVYHVNSLYKPLGDYRVELDLKWDFVNKQLPKGEFEDTVIKRYASGYQIVDKRLLQPVVILDPHTNQARSVPLLPAKFEWTWKVYVLVSLSGIGIILLCYLLYSFTIKKYWRNA
jgi:hypothetical protein